MNDEVLEIIDYILRLKKILYKRTEKSEIYSRLDFEKSYGYYGKR